MEKVVCTFGALSSFLLCVAAGCVSEPQSEVPSKERARQNAKNDAWMADGDFCDIYGWYGDSECDTFCPSPDPDCQSEPSCKDGTVMEGSSFRPSLDGMECEATVSHCLTKDFSACPQFSLRPPTWCAEGTVTSGESVFVASTDGMKCEIQSVHCVTKNASACPLFTPRAPTWCAGGEVVRAASTFIASTDGMECEIPSVHCLSPSAAMCSADEPASN